MEAASYWIEGTGPDPNSDTFLAPDNTTGRLQVPGLSPGFWTVTVDARNAAGTLIGHGETYLPCARQCGWVTIAQISVAALSGTGSLDLTVQWTKGAHPNASVECSLISMITGEDLAPVFSMIPSKDPMKATYQNTAIVQAGYYLLLRGFMMGVRSFGALRVGGTHHRRAGHESDMDHELRQYADI